jgi:GMP synthase-like glutamine amidotransferase
MGGPMGAYDDVDVPWLGQTKNLLADAVERGVPTLGICLGAQLLAVATGGKVERGASGPELGLCEVTGDGTDRVLLSGPYVVVQWHYDTVTELPAGATLLASSELYQVQAFRVGEAAWGLQFHVEATAELVGKWARAEGREPAEIVDPIRRAEKSLALVGEAIARRFAYVVNR